MSVRRRINKEKAARREQDFIEVEGCLGLWKSADEDAADVLVRVYRAVRGEARPLEHVYKLNRVSLFAEIVQMDSIAGFSIQEQFPWKMKQYLPNTGTFLEEVMLQVGRKSHKRKGNFVVLRGYLRRAGVEWTSDQP